MMMKEKKVIKEMKTPIKYLVKKLNKIDSSLTVKPLTDNPDYIVFNGKISEQEEVLYYFNQRQYSSYGLMRFIEDHNTDDFIEINKAINVWLNSKEKNGSTMPFEDDISNDSQKKTKEHLIHDFIKDAALMGFQCSPNQFYDAQTADIDVFDGESKYIMDICFLSGARTFMVDDMEIDDLKRYSWLFTRVSMLISDLRGEE